MVIFLDNQLLMLFGAEKTLLPLAKSYLFPVKFVVPSFLLTQLVAAFLRNDGNPVLATAMGSVFSLIMMLTHFCSKKNTLRIEKPTNLISMFKSISVTGFSTFFIDVAMGILTMLFNRQILKYSLITAAVFGVIWTAIAEFTPNLFVRIFMIPTESILKIAPDIIRRYGISFLLLPLNVFSTYYFQALMKPLISFIVSVSRGAVISGILIYLLPVAADKNSI